MGPRYGNIVGFVCNRKYWDDRCILSCRPCGFKRTPNVGDWKVLRPGSYLSFVKDQ